MLWAQCQLVCEVASKCAVALQPDQAACYRNGASDEESGGDADMQRGLCCSPRERTEDALGKRDVGDSICQNDRHFAKAADPYDILDVSVISPISGILLKLTPWRT